MGSFMFLGLALVPLRVLLLLGEGWPAVFRESLYPWEER
jgi:hypothetical protein